MATRAERQAMLIAEQMAFAHQLRAIEAVHHTVHQAMLDWGRWGQERFPGAPELRPPSIWDLPGDTPDWYEATPEAPEEPIDERRVLVLDARINDKGFPALWLKIVRANYMPWRGGPRLIEWERPRVAKISEPSFLEQLHLTLLELDR